MPRVCAKHGCPYFANKRGTYCDIHDPRPALYTPEWKKYSLAVRAERTVCEACGVRPSVGVDHTTGLAVCAECHRPDVHGGVRVT